MSKIYIILIVFCTLDLGILYFKEIPTPNTPSPVAPQPAPLPLQPLQPVQPQPQPQPQPPQKARISKLLIVVERNCQWCNKLKNDWKNGFPVPHEYRQNSQEMTNNWNIQGTPTIIGLNERGLEVDRKLGYTPKEELEEWIKQ